MFGFPFFRLPPISCTLNCMKGIIFISLTLICSAVFTVGEGIETAKNNIALKSLKVNFSPGPEYGGDTRIFQGIPGIERSRGGRLWAAWYGGGDTEGPDNYVMLVTSGNDGASWSDSKLVIDPEGQVRAFDPCLWIDPTGRLWLFWAQAYHFWDGRGGVWAITTEKADQEKPDWSSPHRLADGVMMNKPISLEDGTWLLPAAAWNIPINGGIHSCPKPVGEAMRAYISDWETGGRDAWPAAFEKFKQLKVKFAALIGADARNSYN